MWWTGWRNWCPAMRWMGYTLTITSTPPPTRPSTRPSLRPAARRTWKPGGGRTSPPWSRRPTTPSRPRTPTLRFGVSPQGNPDNDVHQQYRRRIQLGWRPRVRTPVVDYLCPQLYWGYGYTLSGGSERFAYPNILAEWLAMPRGLCGPLHRAGRLPESETGTAAPTPTARPSGPPGRLWPGRWPELRAQGAGGLCPVPVWLAVRKQRLASARPGRMPGFADGKQRRRGCLKGKSAV